MKLIRWMLLMCLLTSGAWAQNYTTVIATNITTSSGAKLRAGKLCFTATDGSDTTINYQVGGGGQVIIKPVCTPVSNGGIGVFAIANSDNTIPIGVLFRIEVLDATGVVLTYKLTVIHGASFNLDTYIPPVGPISSGISVPSLTVGVLSVTSCLGSGCGHTIQSNGVSLTGETKLNFLGGVTCVDNPGVSTDCTGASSPVQSVFGRTANVTAQSGDYAVGQITGAEASANKNQASGYAGLDSSTLLLAAQHGTGTPSSTTLLFGDRTWRALSTTDIPDISATYLKLAGGTMSGAIVVPVSPIVGLQAAGASNTGLTFFTTGLLASVGGTSMWFSGSTVGQALQLGSTSAFGWASGTAGSGANDAQFLHDGTGIIAQRSGATNQDFNVYRTFTDASNYSRVRVTGNDAGGSVAISYECAGTGPCNLNLDLLAASGTTGNVAIGTSGTRSWLNYNSAQGGNSSRSFGAASHNGLDIGGVTTGPRYITIGSAFNVSLTNDASTGTTTSLLVKLTGAPSTVVKTATTDTSGAVGICIQNCGTTTLSAIAQTGVAPCVFDGATTAGDYVQISSTVIGNCHDAGSGVPGTGQIIGRVLSTNGAGGTYNVLLQMKSQ